MKTNVLAQTVKVVLVMVFLAGLSVPSWAATPPLVPFDTTGDLFVLDDGSGNVLGITPEGNVYIAIPQATILAATGLPAVSFEDCGIAFDAQGNMYFSVWAGRFEEDREDGLICKMPKGGNLFVLTSSAAIMLATDKDESMPMGIAFDSNGILYANDDYSESVLRIDPNTGAVTVYASMALLLATFDDELPDWDYWWVDMNCPIIGGENGILYAATEGGPAAIFGITNGDPTVVAAEDPYDSNDPLNDLESFMTRDQSGALFIADNGSDSIKKVNPATGAVQEFLSFDTLFNVTGDDPEVHGGIAFDDQGDFFLADEASDGIYRFNAANGFVGAAWVTAEDMFAVTGQDPDLEGGIAFESKADPEPEEVEPTPAKKKYRKNDDNETDPWQRILEGNCFIGASAGKGQLPVTAVMLFALFLGGVCLSGIFLGLKRKKQ